MKANELRIGNFFMDAKDRLCSVDEISKDIEDCRISSIHDCITTHPIKPIPLTEEWLLKFGFDESMNDKYKYYLKPTALFRGLGDCNDRFYYFMSGQSKAIEIKHVHQLQNLYFALTGEELTLKS